MKSLLLLGVVITALTGLTGCAVAVVGAGGVAAGSSLAGDNRPMKTINQDHDATFQANNRLSASKALEGKVRATATVFNHEMLLVGQATSEESKKYAEEVVRSVPNVTKIYNQIAVQDHLGALAAISDSTLTSNIRARLLATNDLKSNQFKVVTEDGVVYLMGLTTRSQAELAIKTVRESSGVKRVVTLIRYVN